MIEAVQLTVVDRVNGRNFAAKGLHAERGHGIADITFISTIINI
jgi:hypothetical protein